MHLARTDLALSRKAELRSWRIFFEQRKKKNPSEGKILKFDYSEVFGEWAKPGNCSEGPNPGGAEHGGAEPGF